MIELDKLSSSVGKAQAVQVERPDPLSAARQLIIDAMIDADLKELRDDIEEFHKLELEYLKKELEHAKQFLQSPGVSVTIIDGSVYNPLSLVEDFG